MGQFSIGQSVRRREDPRLLKGRGRFYDDLKLAGELHAAIVRSPHAHADIRGIDARAALQMPGVHAVLTGEDYRKPTGSARCRRWRPTRSATAARCTCRTRPAIAIGRAMHVGYPVAVVVADTLDLARDAAERVAVDYAPRPAVVSARGRLRARRAAALRRLPEQRGLFLPGRQQGRGGRGVRARRARGRAAPRHQPRHRQHARAARRHRRIRRRHRQATRCIAASSGRGCSATTSPRPRSRFPKAELRLVTGDIGGSYGLRGSIYPEIILMLWAARRAGRPVKWLATRNEAHISDDDARDNIVDAALALDKDGKFLARAHPQLRQSRRVRVVPRRHAAGGQHRHGVRRLHHAGAACGDLRHADQHALHLALPRRRPARGVLHDRAADRHRRRRDEDRSGGAAPPQHHPAVGDALQDAAHLHLRQRPLRGEHGPHHEARRLAGLRGAAQGGGEARQAARPRPLQHHRAGRRSDHRDRGNPLRSARRHDLRHRLDLARPGPRHHPDADPGRPARRRSRADQVHPGRHRRGRVRHGHRRLALDHHERRRHRPGRATRSSPRARSSPRTCWRRPRPTSSSRTAASPSPAPTAASASTTWPRPRSSSTSCRPAWSPASTRPRPIARRSGNFPERLPCLRGRDRSRHRRRRRSSATGWWTTSAP